MTATDRPHAADRLAAIPRRDVAGLPFSVVPLLDAVDMLVDLGRRPPTHGVAVAFANAYSIALADTDAEYRQVLRRADLLASDGMPVVWAGQRLHPTLAGRWTRVYGPDVMTAVLARSDSAGPRHYLVGATAPTLAALRGRIARQWPAAVVVGAESPPFRPETPAERDERDARIRAAGATVVWVGLGTPKQDVEARRLADRLPVTALAVGAAFDFLAGTVHQAPRWMQRSGLEWSYRWAREPRRLTRRYLWGNPRFVWAVGRQVVSRADRARP